MYSSYYLFCLRLCCCLHVEMMTMIASTHRRVGVDAALTGIAMMIAAAKIEVVRIVRGGEG